jgi:site-specific recombinase XerD
MDQRQIPLIPAGPAESKAVQSPLTADTSLKAAILAFKKYMRYEGFSHHTVQAFSSDLNLLGHYLGIGQCIGQVTVMNLNDFLSWMLNERDAPCSPKTYARRVTTLKVFFKWLHEGGVLTSDPAAPVLQHSVRSPLPTILTRREIARLVQTAEEVGRGTDDKKGDTRPLLLLQLLLQTGIKKGEAMDIVANHIDRTDPERPVLFIRYRNPARRYKERKIPLAAEWLAVLDEYLAQYQPTDTLFTCTPRNLEYVLRDLEEQAAVDKAVSFECLRWTSAVRSHVEGVDPDELRERMGLSRVTWRETFSKIKRLAPTFGA